MHQNKDTGGVGEGGGGTGAGALVCEVQKGGAASQVCFDSLRRLASGLLGVVCPSFFCRFDIDGMRCNSLLQSHKPNQQTPMAASGCSHLEPNPQLPSLPARSLP